MNYHKFRRTFNNVTYNVAIPQYGTLHNRAFRILLSQHGSRDSPSSLDGVDYLQYPLDYDDPFLYDLIVVAPTFPPGTNFDPTSTPEGANFQRFDGPGLKWLHELFHVELPKLFSENTRDVQINGHNVIVELNRFYFFGHSRGGMAVHSYIMKFGSNDIFSALSGSGKLIQRSHSSYASPQVKNDQDYLNRLDEFIKSPVISLLGTDEGGTTGQARIRNIREFICREIKQRVSSFGLKRILPNPDPPVPILNNVQIACNTFPAPSVSIPVKNPPIDEFSIRYRFVWNPGSDHRGWKNYRFGRTMLFQGREKKTIALFTAADPYRASKLALGVDLMDPKLKLKADLEEQLDIGDPL